MQNCGCYKPSTGFVIADLETKIVEIILNLHEELGVKAPNEVLFKMYELAFPFASDKEKEEFNKIQAAFRCINVMVSKNQDVFLEMLAERIQYKKKYDELLQK